MKPTKNTQNVTYNSTESNENLQRFEPHHLPMPARRNSLAGFFVKGHKRDTDMRAYSIPEINTTDDNKWFVWYNHIVPADLRKYYGRGSIRIKVYAGINRIPVEDRAEYAKGLIMDILSDLKSGKTPFEKDYERIEELRSAMAGTSRRDMLCADVLPIFAASRVERGLVHKSILAYTSTTRWLIKGIGHLRAGQVKYPDVSTAMSAAIVDGKWGSTNINKEWEYVLTIFNWMEIEDYVIKNPCKGKIVRLPTAKSAHKWYDKDTAVKVKDAIRSSGVPWLINVCQFTYEILIRSKQELMSIKVGDIDFELRRINFRKEWTKNATDQSRDYSDAFHALVTDVLGLDQLPNEWYVFGKGGIPGKVPCGHNFFSYNWEKVRSDIGLGDEYTIYGWKHTAIVHDMMKGINGYDISHRARHSAVQTTDDYKRDYDITLNRVYSAEDLKF